MTFALALALVGVLGGTLVSYAYDDDAPLPVRLAYGTATGFVALAMAGFILAHLVGIATATTVAGILVALPLLALTRTDLRDRVVLDLRATGAALRDAVRLPALRTTGPLVYGLVMIVFLVLVFERVIVEANGTLSTGYVNNLGDLPFHLQVTASFAFGENFPPEDPTYAGTGFAYPYMADFLAALFVTAGATMAQAYFIANLALGLSLVALLYRFTRVLTFDRLAAYLAPLLVLFSGGLGFVILLDDVAAGENGIVGALTTMTHDYTITGEGPYRWGNAITTLLVTQRSLLFGLPIALIVFVLLWRLIHTDRPRSMHLALTAGILTGSLPLVHAHSFVVVLGTAFFIGLFFRQWRDRMWQPWAVYVLVALALALPGIWWSTHDSIANAGTFFGFEFGWDRREVNPALFWLLNTGLFIPLAVAGAFWPVRPRIANRTLLLFTAAFIVWFIVPNVMKLAPWVWDNIKVLFYWYVGFVPLVALVLSRMLRAGGGWRPLGAVALAVLMLAGGLDVWRVVSRQVDYQEFEADGLALADLIMEETAPSALILHAPTYNPPVFLTGRRSLLGYTGYIWAHGLEYAEREADIKRIYAGEADAEALLDKYGIDYIEVTPLERGSMEVDDAFFERFTRVGEAGAYQLFAVPRP